MEPETVTPSRASHKVKNSPRLGNIVGLMNIMSPTKQTIKDGHVVQSIRDIIHTIDNSNHTQGGNTTTMLKGVNTKKEGKTEI